MDARVAGSLRGCGGDAGDAASEESGLAKTVGTGGGGGGPAGSSQTRPGRHSWRCPEERTQVTRTELRGYQPIDWTHGCGTQGH